MNITADDLFLFSKEIESLISEHLEVNISKDVKYINNNNKVDVKSITLTFIVNFHTFGIVNYKIFIRHSVNPKGIYYYIEEAEECIHVEDIKVFITKLTRPLNSVAILLKNTFDFDKVKHPFPAPKFTKDTYFYKNKKCKCITVQSIASNHIEFYLGGKELMKTFDNLYDFVAYVEADVDALRKILS